MPVESAVERWMLDAGIGGAGNTRLMEKRKLRDKKREKERNTTMHSGIKKYSTLGGIYFYAIFPTLWHNL